VLFIKRWVDLCIEGCLQRNPNFIAPNKFTGILEFVYFALTYFTAKVYGKTRPQEFKPYCILVTGNTYVISEKTLRKKYMKTHCKKAKILIFACRSRSNTYLVGACWKSKNMSYSRISFHFLPSTASCLFMLDLANLRDCSAATKVNDL